MAKLKTWKHKYSQPGASMELTEHLDELRDRLIWCLVALILGFVAVGLPLNRPVLRLLEAPFQRFARPASEAMVIEVAPDGTLRLAKESLPAVRQAAQATAADAPKTDDDATSMGLHPSQLRLRLPDGSETAWGLDTRQSLFFFSPVEPFVLRIKVALLIGLVLALPVVLWNVWRFMSPGLTDSERVFVRRGLQGAVVLFPAGVAFAYFFIGYAIYFLLQYGEDFIPAISLSAYVNLALMLMLGMGVVFEFPLVLLLLVRVGIVDARKLEGNRPIVALVLLFVAAVVTPPDPFTMLFLAAPLYLLFEITLGLIRAFGLNQREGAVAAAVK